MVAFISGIAGREWVEVRGRLGRADTASVRVLHPKVSRNHCKISFDGGFYVVEDLKSKNGTWLNGKLVERSIMFHGDMLSLGEQEFLFQLYPESNEAHAAVTLYDTDTDIDEEDFATQLRQVVRPGSGTQDLVDVSSDEDITGHASELREDLGRICRVINLVNAEQDLDRLFEIIMDNVMELSGADRGHLFVSSDPGGAIMPLVSRRANGLPISEGGAFSRSIIRECYENGCAILRADPVKDRGMLTESMIRQDIQSIICVPMQCDEGVVGVIYVDRIGGSGKFTKRHLKLLTALGNQSGIAVRRAQLTRQVETLFENCMRTLVSTIESKDEYTLSHSERVTAVAVLIGKLQGLGKGDLRELRLAGLLHDVGKVATDDRILKKQGKLTPQEYESIKFHAVAGANIVASVDNADRIAGGVRHHHERFDGTGYPDGLRGEDIPLFARILSIADAFDSMVAGRPYRAPLPLEKVLCEFETGKGTQFDPFLVDVFLGALRSDSGFQQKMKDAYRKQSVTTPLPRGLVELSYQH